MSEQPEARRLAGILRDSAETINGVAFELEHMHALLAHIQLGAPAPAEVPMPDTTDIAGYTPQALRDYGDAREAAGYARWRKEAGRDAEIEALRLYVRVLCKAVDAATDFAGTVAGGASWWDDVWADHAAALDRARERVSQAALRGEVKP